MKKTSKRSLAWTTAIAPILVGSPAHGQSTEPPTIAAVASGTDSPVSRGTQLPPTSDAKTQSSGEMADIVVTANKRNENLSKVGLSITALSGDKLAQRNIAMPEDLARSIPSLALAPSTHGTPVYNLRGVGYNGDALAVYPAVSISLDQAPLTFPVLANHTLYDLERVEVLKGPQGTLFGQNSTGGQINYVAAKPTSTPKAGLDLEYGRFNEVHGSGFASGPVTDTLGVRVAFDAAHRDDWQYSITRDATNGRENYLAGRIILDWKPTDRLKLELDVNGSIDKSQPQALQLIGVLPTTPSSPTVQEETSPFAPDDARAADWSPDQSNPHSDRKLLQTFLRADFDISDAVTLTSITTYNHLVQHAAYDIDGSAYHLVDVQNDVGRIEDFNEEVRFSNANGGAQRFRWTVGATYNHSKTHELQHIIYPDNSLNLPTLDNIGSSTVTGDGKISNYASFANAEYDITPQLTVKSGLRYTKSDNRNDSCTFTNGDPNSRLDKLFSDLGLIFGGRRIVLGPNDCTELGSDNLPTVSHDINKLDEHNVSWRIGADFKLSTDTLLYANISRGYKAGGFTVIAVAEASSLKPAKQEYVTSYEAGLKTKLLANHVQVNFAGYYEDYRDKQIQGTTFSSIVGLLQNLQNVPKSHVYGVEADLIVRPMTGLTLTGSASYLKSEVDRYSGLNAVGIQTDFKGDRLPFAPKISLHGDIDYRIRMPGGGEIFMGAAASYQSETVAYVGGDSLTLPDNGANRSKYIHPYDLPGYALVDLRAGYTLPSGKVSVSAFGKNVFNTFYTTNAISYNDNIPRTVGMPATWGVALGLKF